MTPKLEITRICMHTILGSVLTRNSIVLDCGSNRGDFARQLSSEKKCEIYGFEPNPLLFKNLPPIERVRFFPFAIADKSGMISLNAADGQDLSMSYHKSAATSFVSAQSVTIESILKDQNLTKIDLIKLDIEGAELSVLETIPVEILETVGQITVEFHDFLSPSERPRVKKIIKRLRESGFYVVRASFYDYSDVLCVNRRYFPLNWLDIIKIKLNAQTLRGGRQMIARIKLKLRNLK